MLYKVNRPKIYYKILNLRLLYIFSDLTIMQQDHQQVTVVTSFGLLFRPSSDHASLRVKEKSHSLLNVKMGRDLTPLV